MATGMAKIPLTKNKVFARSVPTRYILEGLVLKLCVYFISISCGTYMGGKGLTLRSSFTYVKLFLNFCQLICRRIAEGTGESSAEPV